MKPRPTGVDLVVLARTPEIVDLAAAGLPAVSALLLPAFVQALERLARQERSAKT